jgi:PhnB protein
MTHSQGLQSVIPAIVVRDAAKAIEFYKRAFGAEELMRMAGPDGKTILHAELKIGDSVIFLSDESPKSECNFGLPRNQQSPRTLGATTGALNLYVKDVDSAFKKAVDAGGTVTMPVADMFWGDRYGQLVDPFGHTWSIGAKKEQLTQQQIDQRTRQFFAGLAKQPAEPAQPAELVEV